MHKKALTVAIAGALAAPMAAQAVDFTISGHVARALVITDTDGGTRAQEKDSGSTGSRIRVVGSGELMDGTTAGVKLEYAAGTALVLRYADLHYAGEFGKVSIGHGDDGGEGSVYSDKSGVLGIGHGQDMGAITIGKYFGSLDGGGARGNRIRYDTPSIGPISAAISVGNGDEVSAGVSLSQSFGDTAFGAKIGTNMSPGDTGTVSASAGIKLPAGVTVSGAWGQGDNHLMGMTAGSISCAAATGTVASDDCVVTPAVAGNVVDPSFFQATVGYVMGDTSVAASWYASSDMMNEGSEGTAIGIGANHNMPKINANVFVAAQNYAVEDMAAGVDTDQTVVMIGTRIMF